MAAPFEPEVVDLAGNYWTGLAFAIVMGVLATVVVGEFHLTPLDGSFDLGALLDHPKSIFVGMLAGVPFGLSIWARAPKRLVIDEHAITLVRALTTRVIPQTSVKAVLIVDKRVRSGQTIRLVSLLLRTGEQVLLPSPDGGADEIYIAICSRRHADANDGDSHDRGARTVQ